MQFNSSPIQLLAADRHVSTSVQTVLVYRFDSSKSPFKTICDVNKSLFASHAYNWKDYDETYNKIIVFSFSHSCVLSAWTVFSKQQGESIVLLPAEVSYSSVSTS